jgi:hypothetical protein
VITNLSGSAKIGGSRTNEATLVILFTKKPSNDPSEVCIKNAGAAPCVSGGAAAAEQFERDLSDSKARALEMLRDTN